MKFPLAEFTAYFPIKTTDEEQVGSESNDLVQVNTSSHVINGISNVKVLSHQTKEGENITSM